MADEVIKRLVTQFVIDAGDALTKGKQMAEMTQKVKAEIKALMEQGLSMKDAWSGLFSANITQKIDATRASIAALKAELKAMGESGVSTIGGGTSTTKAELQAQQAILAQLNKEAKAYGIAGRNAQAEIAKEVQNLNRAYQANVLLQKNAAGSLQQTASAANSARTGFAGLGDVAKYVFGTILGLGAIQVLQKLIAFFTQAMQAGLEFSKSLFQLDVAVRALRRSGLDITLQEVYANLDKIQTKFGVFARTELREGAAAFFNLNRDLNLTKEQLFDIQNAVATLAVVNGRSMDEVQRTVALALSSGYTEGLQRLGVSINRVTIAEQAAVMGWKQGYTALTENQRAQATAVLLLEKTLKYEEDLAEYQKTLPGKIEIGTKAWKDMTAAIGELLLPLKKLGVDLLVVLGENILYVVPVIGVLVLALQNLLRFIAAVPEGLDAMKQALIENLKAAADFAGLMPKIYSRDLPMKDKLTAIDEYIYKGLGENAFVPLDDSAKKLAADVSDILDTLEKEFQDILTDHERKLRDLETDFLRDIAKIDRDLANNLAEIDRDLQNKKDKVYAKYFDDLAKLEQDYQDNVSDALWDAANKRSQLEANYREKELKEEIKYQETMRKLREGFLFDLEDALRERDALQILRLIRRYNLEKKQQTREHQIAEDENKRQYAQELKELEVQTARKLEVLKRELDQRRKALSDELTAEIIAEIAAAKYKKEEAERQAAIAKSERQIRWDEQIADEMLRMDDRINDLADKYAREESLTKDHVDAIIKEFERAFGAGGAVQKLYDRFMQMVANGMAVAGWMDAGMGGYIPSTSVGGGENTGGTVPSLTPTPSLPSGGPGGPIENMPEMTSVGAPAGQLAIELFLSPDLQAKIVNNTLDRVANVLVEVQRKV